MKLLNFLTKPKQEFDFKLTTILAEADIFGYSDKPKGKIKGQDPFGYGDKPQEQPKPKQNIWDYPEEKPETKPISAPETTQKLTVDDFKVGESVRLKKDMTSLDGLRVYWPAGNIAQVKKITTNRVEFGDFDKSDPAAWLYVYEPDALPSEDEPDALPSEDIEHFEKVGWSLDNLEKVKDSAKLRIEDVKIGDKLRALKDVYFIDTDDILIPAGNIVKVTDIFHYDSKQMYLGVKDTTQARHYLFSDEYDRDDREAMFKANKNIGNFEKVS